MAVDLAKEPSLDEILKDFPPGPLDLYRKKASFDWKQMKLFIEGEDILKFKVCFFSPPKCYTVVRHGWISFRIIALPRVEPVYCRM